MKQFELVVLFILLRKDAFERVLKMVFDSLVVLCIFGKLLAAIVSIVSYHWIFLFSPT